MPFIFPQPTVADRSLKWLFYIFLSSLAHDRCKAVLAHQSVPLCVALGVCMCRMSYGAGEREKNLDTAFRAATGLGIPQLLDVEDMLIATPDKFSVMTYLRCAITTHARTHARTSRTRNI